jgi:hypothetical protein
MSDEKDKRVMDPLAVPVSKLVLAIAAPNAIYNQLLGAVFSARKHSLS